MGGRVDPSDQWWTKDSAPNIKDCTSMDAFLEELRLAGDKLVVVDFYARWCGACRALHPKLCKIAVQNPDVIFLKIEFDDNKEMCRSMGVKVLPYFHMYKGKDGKVASFSASLSKVNRLREALAEHAGNGNIVPRPAGKEHGEQGAGAGQEQESEQREPMPTR
jgi:thiol-disulfide isomerase/thioredoxin